MEYGPINMNFRMAEGTYCPKGQ